jgi:serine/threonine protein kinase
MSPDARTATPPSAPGEPIAPGYEVIEHLRRGNDLDVYDAWSHERMARCVVKALRPDRLGKQSARRALLLEGELLRKLTHPHIVRAYEVRTDPTPLVVLETLGGETLAHMIDSGEEATTADVAHLGLHLGSALHHLHAHGHLHLDLKPSNVIAEGGRAKLLDLSLARPPGRVSAGMGTWHYLAPEQARGDVVSAATDVWGLGATLFETATGEAPFDDDPDAFAAAPSATGTFSEPDPDRYPQLERRARRVAEVEPATNPALADALDHCLEADPGDRPTLRALMARLEPLAGLPAEERRWSYPRSR